MIIPRRRPWSALRGARRPITLRRRLIGGFERPEPPPVSPRSRSSEKRGAPHAWPRSVRNLARCPPPRPSNRPATNCSRTSCAAASWKPPPSTRRNGSTTRCCTSPSATMRWTSSGWRSCACWASATADRWWRGARPWVRAPERRRLERISGRPLSRAPSFLVRPPRGEAPKATPQGEPHPAAQSELRVPPPSGARPLVDAEQRRQIARAPRPSRADERQPQPPLRPDAPALPRAEQELRVRRQADAQRPPVVAARGREGETSRPAGAPRHSQLRTPEVAVRQDHGGPGADLRGAYGLRAHRHRHAHGEPGRGDHGPSPVPTLRAQTEETSATPRRNGASEARRRR